MTTKALAERAEALSDWFTKAALPLWLDRGLDWNRGGCFEALDQTDAGPIGDFRRLRVVTRQIYVFAAGIRLGANDARAGLDHTLAFLRGAARHSEGGFANRFDLDGKTTDETRDLYDLAFVAFALAHAYDVIADEALREDAHALASFITGRMKHPEGGFREALPDREPRRQNPHMHLLEAALAWSELDPDGPYHVIASEILNLFKARFVQSESASLPEYYDAALAPILGSDGRIVTEPGHHFEWAWLLHHAERLGFSESQAGKEALLASGRARGISEQSGMPYGEVDTEGHVLNFVTRLWSTTEWAKAEAVAGTTDGAARATGAIQRFLDTPVSGLWHERWDETTQTFVPGPAPATSFYHITLALETLREALGTHPRPFAADA